ncbi:MAG: hypothetical protein QOD70_1913, partial [Frankiales bacterium]|nr:hypothetical protein [Frankiales bacterium]
MPPEAAGVGDGFAEPLGCGLGLLELFGLEDDVLAGFRDGLVAGCGDTNTGGTV